MFAIWVSDGNDFAHGGIMYLYLLISGNNKTELNNQMGLLTAPMLIIRQNSG
jgi:hypothetical protein